MCVCVVFSIVSSITLCFDAFKSTMSTLTFARVCPAPATPTPCHSLSLPPAHYTPVACPSCPSASISAAKILIKLTHTHKYQHTHTHRLTDRYKRNEASLICANKISTKCLPPKRSSRIEENYAQHFFLFFIYLLIFLSFSFFHIFSVFAL